jgi:hypothetical protein
MHRSQKGGFDVATPVKAAQGECFGYACDDHGIVPRHHGRCQLFEREILRHDASIVDFKPEVHVGWKWALLWAWAAVSALWVAVVGTLSFTGAFLVWVAALYTFVPPVLLLILGSACVGIGIGIAAMFRRQ